jgi:phosphatidylglycerophosphate synthase
MIRTGPTAPLTALIAQVPLFAALAVAVGLSGVGLNPAGWVVGVACGVITNAALARGLSRYRADRLGPADWVTLARATLVVGVAALVADSFGEPAPVTMLVSFAALALALDAVDGWVARRTRTTATLGAHFDAEVDAFLILILSVYVARSVGVWVLAIGAARYVFLVAGSPLPWMREPLPPRYWRKVVAATQGIVLTIAAAGRLSAAVTTVMLVGALILLAESFGRDVWWLRRNRRHSLPQAGADHTPDDQITPPARRGRVRRRIGVGLSIGAVALVWAALVVPDQPGYLKLDAFLRVPLELLVLIALALVLPIAARRLLAVSAALVLGLVIVLKAANYEMLTNFNRPLDPLGDTSQLGTGIETLRSIVGRTEMTLIEIAVVAGIVVGVVLLILAMLRLTRLAADNRRPALRAIAALAAIWLLCRGVGVQVVSHTPIASASSAGFLVTEVRAVRADIHDSGVFAKQIDADRFRNTPTDQLLTGLRGKDVLLVFVESYGQVSVQHSRYAPAVDALLDRGTKTLQASGFSARTAFLDAPGFGGMSWLGHSTLQAGVWANTQRRYDQLVGSKRFNLAEAFGRAGWRTINFAPADDRAWPTGSSFYHYAKLYDGRDIGYHGPTFTYAPMPDQYMFAALQRLELSKTHRKPVFAEVDTVSSHLPWSRIPEQIPWNELGNGSIFNHIPRFSHPGFWGHPNEVRAAYLKSIEYSLNVLISYITHYGNKNLVLVVVGDEQPVPVVSGPNATHDVPISIIAHDPKVLKQIGSWGWGAGLRPNPQAPVWPMSAFRDRFLGAYDSQPATR